MNQKAKLAYFCLETILNLFGLLLQENQFLLPRGAHIYDIGERHSGDHAPGHARSGLQTLVSRLMQGDVMPYIVQLQGTII